MNSVEKANGLAPLDLIRIPLNEFAGYGIFNTPEIKPRGGVFFHHMPQHGGKLRFIVQMTPVEWPGEGELPTPPHQPQLVKLKVENGWLKIEVPVWGSVLLLPGDSELQRLLQVPRGQGIEKLRVSFSRTTRHLLLSFQQD